MKLQTVFMVSKETENNNKEIFLYYFKDNLTLKQVLALELS